MHFAAQNAAPEVVDFLITEDPDSVVTASDVRMRGIPCRHALALVPTRHLRVVVRARA